MYTHTYTTCDSHVKIVDSLTLPFVYFACMVVHLKFIELKLYFQNFAKKPALLKSV
jgi:hypothetical protein